MRRADLFAHLARTAFAPAARGAPPTVGLEVELLPVDARTRRPAPIVPVGDAPGTLPVLRQVAGDCGWREEFLEKSGVPGFETPQGGRITYEPGGQLEYSAAPRHSASVLLADVRRVVDRLREALDDAGIATLTLGIDPTNGIELAAPQLSGERYRRMAAHFDSLGPYGAMMMRQTASIQVCLGNGPDPVARWRLLNALAPYVVATFANSPWYAGLDSGHHSFRRHVWASVDPTRTGMLVQEHGEWRMGNGAGVTDAVGAYVNFASNAAALFDGGEEVPYRPFGDAVRAGCSMDAWERHLTTLFPEVRPRGYFEVRSCDALAPEWYAAPVAFLYGLALSQRHASAALEVAAAADHALLERAGRHGLDDAHLAARAGELFELALEACAALGPEFLSEEDLDTAHRYCARFTRAHRAPASDLAADATA